MAEQTNKQSTVKVRGKLLRITNLQMFKGTWQIGLQVEVKGTQPAPYFNLQSMNKAELEDFLRIETVSVGDDVEFDANGKIIVGNKITVFAPAKLPEKEEAKGQSKEDLEAKESLFNSALEGVDMAIELQKKKQVDISDGNWARYFAGSLNVERRMRRR